MEGREQKTVGLDRRADRNPPRGRVAIAWIMGWFIRISRRWRLMGATGVMCPHPPPHQWLRRNLDSALAQAQPPHRSLRMGGEIRQIRVEPSSCVIGSPTCARTKRFRSSLPQGMMRDSNRTGRRTNSPCSREGPSVDGTGCAACHHP